MNLSNASYLQPVNGSSFSFYGRTLDFTKFANYTKKSKKIKTTDYKKILEEPPKNFKLFSQTMSDRINLNNNKLKFNQTMQCFRSIPREQSPGFFHFPLQEQSYEQKYEPKYNVIMQQMPAFSFKKSKFKRLLGQSYDKVEQLVDEKQETYEICHKNPIHKYFLDSHKEEGENKLTENNNQDSGQELSNKIIDSSITIAITQKPNSDQKSAAVSSVQTKSINSLKKKANNQMNSSQLSFLELSYYEEQKEKMIETKSKKWINLEKQVSRSRTPNYLTNNDLSILSDHDHRFENFQMQKFNGNKAHSFKSYTGRKQIINKTLPTYNLLGVNYDRLLSNTNKAHVSLDKSVKVPNKTRLENIDISPCAKLDYPGTIQAFNKLSHAKKQTNVFFKNLVPRKKGNKFWPSTQDSFFTSKSRLTQNISKINNLTPSKQFSCSFYAMATEPSQQ